MRLTRLLFTSTCLNLLRQRQQEQRIVCAGGCCAALPLRQTRLWNAGPARDLRLCQSGSA